MQFAKTFPFFSRLLLGPGNELWVQDYNLEDSFGVANGVTARPSVWYVYATNRPLAMLEVPAGVKLLDIGEDWILCLVSRDDGQDVALMRLDRAPSN